MNQDDIRRYSKNAAANAAMTAATPPTPAAKALTSSDVVAELEAALSQLCSAREILKRDEDSSDYYRISHQIERLCSMIARRGRSATVPSSAASPGGKDTDVR